ncbi:MAG: AraC family transcriptional regulator [Eubacteriaceae bacterium]|jgi:AraC-like DNA-binding protein
MRVMNDTSEVVNYNDPRIPVYSVLGSLSDYRSMKALCHWHEDFEMIQVLEGQMKYAVNGKEVLIQEGDGIIVNSRQLHYGYSVEGGDCRFICLLFSPALLCAQREISEKYILPVIESGPEYCSLDGSTETGHEMLDLITQIYEVRKDIDHDPGAQMKAIGLMHILFGKWLTLTGFSQTGREASEYSEIAAQKDMVTFISRNYASNLTLDQIASAGNVCRSRCCQIFKKYQKTSPIDFLNDYRLKMSMNLLRDSSRSITDIAYICGFRHSSYYAEMFRKKTGCTPREYRKSQIPHDSEE